MVFADLTATELLVWGVALHLVIDWPLQNEWIAEHKTSLRHPAGYIHAAAHGVVMLLVFPWEAALGIAVAHLLIDTRRPLELWARVSTQPQAGPLAITIHIWRDQTLHVTTIAIAALIVA